MDKYLIARSKCRSASNSLPPVFVPWRFAILCPPVPTEVFRRACEPMKSVSRATTPRVVRIGLKLVRRGLFCNNQSTRQQLCLGIVCPEDREVRNATSGRYHETYGLPSFQLADARASLALLELEREV